MAVCSVVTEPVTLFCYNIYDRIGLTHNTIGSKHDRKGLWSLIYNWSMGYLQADLNENLARHTSASYDFRRTLGWCWTCITIFMVSLQDLKTYASLVLHSRNPLYNGTIWLSRMTKGNLTCPLRYTYVYWNSLVQTINV